METARPSAPAGLRAALADLERAGGDPAAMCRGGSGAEGLESGGVAVAGGGSSVAPALRRSAAKKEAEEATFWHLLAGLRGFLDASGGALPLEGSVPDMTSTTESFVALQKIYRAKADLDAARGRLANASAREGAETAAAAAPEGLVSEEEARFFCKHAAHVRVMRWRTLAEERDWDAGAREETAKALAAEDTRRCASLYVIHRAADAFLEEAGRFPGAGAFSSREGAGAGPGPGPGPGDKDPLRLPTRLGSRRSSTARSRSWACPGLDAMDDLVAECARRGGGDARRRRRRRRRRKPGGDQARHGAVRARGQDPRVRRGGGNDRVRVTDRADISGGDGRVNGRRARERVSSLTTDVTKRRLAFSNGSQIGEGKTKTRPHLARALTSRSVPSASRR